MEPPAVHGHFYEFEPAKNWLAYARLKIEPLLCDLSAFMNSDSYRILNSDSASSSLMFFTEFSVADLIEYYEEWRRVRDELYDPGKLFAKLSIQVGDNNSLRMETLIYAYLGSLVTHHRTPNIMRFVFACQCPRFFKNYDLQGVFTQKTPTGLQLKLTPAGVLSKMFESPSDLAEKIGYEAESIDREYLREKENTPDDRLSILNMKYYRKLAETDVIKDAPMFATFVERGFGSPFYVFEFEGVSVADFTELLFQIVYSINEMNYHGVRHNDLHSGNIWVNVRPEDAPSSELVYFIDEYRFVVIGNQYQAKIYDFDRSTFTGDEEDIKGLENTATRWTCPQYGACDSVDPKYDLYTFLSDIYSRTTQGKRVTERRSGVRFKPGNHFPREIDAVIVRLFETFAKSSKYRDPMYHASSEQLEDPLVPFGYASRYCNKVAPKWKCERGFEPSDDDLASYDELISSKIFRGMIRNRNKSRVPDVGRENFYVSAKSGLTADRLYDHIFG